jgi:hypothetical protein
MPRIRLASPLRTFPALLLALGLVPATAQAAGTPTITKVSPMKIEVGQTLTISGKGFVAGKGKNTVVFKRDGKAAVFVKADSATATRIVLKVPAKVTPFLKGKDGSAGPQKFRLRVLARKFGKAFTSNKLSPQIGPPGAFSNDSGSIPGCKPDFKSAKDSDDDGTPDAQEKLYKTNPCKADTDGDGVSDTFEIESALDLNSRALPYAGKRPYPNALDGGDAATDYDGDGLSLLDEYGLWMYTTGGGKLPLNYSDGDQDTNVEGSNTPSNGSALDMNGDGYITDDEKDADGDGLTNWDEMHGRMTAGWWAGMFQDEKPFAGAPGAQAMSELSATDPDTDGDGLPDGADDQDQDGMSNLQELDRHTALTPGGQNLWVNPYNPCLPDFLSRTCTLHPPMSDPWAPFPIPPGTTSPLTTTKLGAGPAFIPHA